MIFDPMNVNGQKIQLESAFQRMNILGASRIPFFFIADFEMENVKVFEVSELKDILFDVNGVKNHKITYQQNEIPLTKERIPFFEYKTAFDKVLEELQYGNTFLLNLTRANEIKLKIVCTKYL